MQDQATSASKCTKRITPASVHLDESFLLNVDSEKEVAQQYFELYKHRLQKLRPCLDSVARQKWPDVHICNRILDCQTSALSEVVVIGTCFKDQKKKFNPLAVIDDDDDYEDKTTTNETSHAALLAINVSDGDFVVLEDEIGSLKVSLSGECMNKHRLLTGITLALRGCINSHSGVFIATEMALCGLPPISALPPTLSSDGADKFVAFISGLCLSNLESSHSEALALLFEYLNGFVGDGVCAAQVCRVVIAGNVMNEELPDEDTNIFYDTEFKKKEQKKIASLDSRLRELDAMTAQLAQSVPIDVMPGAHDPSDELLPQQPFHECLFPLSAQLSAFRRVTNPYAVRLDGRLLLGSAGQNFVDMMKHSKRDLIDCMRLSLQSRIIAPTAPDTLSCFPFRGKDPFLITECPRAYFSGNNEIFRSETIEHEDGDGEKVTLLQLPSFEKTKQIVLLNLKTMQPKLIQIGQTPTDSAEAPTAAEE